MLRDGASRAPRPLYQLGYICDQPYFLIVVWTWRHSPTHLQHLLQTCLTRPTTIQPQSTLLGNLSPVPGGAMCTARIAGVASPLHCCIQCRCMCPAAALLSHAHAKPC